MAAQGPENLRDLGKRLDEVQKRQAQRANRPPPTQMGIAFRFATELVAALLVGGGVGWGLDWAIGHWSSFHTRPLFTVLFFMLGAAAGIRNVMRAASQINAEIAGKGPVSSVPEDDEEN
jgi:ATP synthase protein I